MTGAKMPKSQYQQYQPLIDLVDAESTLETAAYLKFCMLLVLFFSEAC